MFSLYMHGTDHLIYSFVRQWYLNTWQEKSFFCAVGLVCKLTLRVLEERKLKLKFKILVASLIPYVYDVNRYYIILSSGCGQSFAKSQAK